MATPRGRILIITLAKAYRTTYPSNISKTKPINQGYFCQELKIQVFGHAHIVAQTDTYSYHSMSLFHGRTNVSWSQTTKDHLHFKSTKLSTHT